MEWKDRGVFCERCHQDVATVHLTSMVDGKTKTQDFCGRCWGEVQEERELPGGLGSSSYEPPGKE